MIEEAHAQGRGEDLERISKHLETRRAAGASAGPVNQLAALMFLIDEEYRLPLQKTIDAFRRWRDRKDDQRGVLRPQCGDVEALAGVGRQAMGFDDEIGFGDERGHVRIARRPHH